MKLRSAIKNDLFAAESLAPTIDSLGTPLVKISQLVDFAELASEGDRIAPRVVLANGRRPPFLTETMVRHLAPKRLRNLSDEHVEFQLLNRLSSQCFCRLTMAANISDHTTACNFEKRIGASGSVAPFDDLTAQLLREGYLARGGQNIDMNLVPVRRELYSTDADTRAAVSPNGIPSSVRMNYV
jgi:hypothetical protein